jgi:hypothetical protein
LTPLAAQHQKFLVSNSLTQLESIPARRLLAEQALREAARSISAAPRLERLAASKTAALVATEVRDGRLDKSSAVDRPSNAAIAYELVNDHGEDALQAALRRAA